MFKQTLAAVRINLTSIPQRASMSAATVLSVALIVAVLLGFLAMANGFNATLSNFGRDDIAVILRSGAQSELNSGLSSETVRLLEGAPGIATNSGGTPLLSGELFVVVDGVKRASNTPANLPLRGLGANGLEVRPGLSIVRGRWFEPGTNELIVGDAVRREFAGFELGETVRLGPNEWVVVGVFSTNGSVFDGEIWADTATLQNLYQRGTIVQSVRAQLAAPNSIGALRDFVAEDPRLNLDIKTEADFFSQQAGATTHLILYLGWPLAIAMAVGALAGAWNTMYASVDSRMREIATLRAIGFGGFPAAIGTMTESLLLAAIGGIIGATSVYLLLDGLSASTLGLGMTQVVFSFTVTADAVIDGLVLALAVGFLGGLIPAIRSATVPLLEVHRG